MNDRARQQRLKPNNRVEDDYVIVRFIAEGATAEVYEARDLRSGERVAIKLLRSVDVAADLAARFSSEADAGKKLDDPHLVRVLDSGRIHDGRPYLVMELLTGQTLDERMAKPDELPIATILEIGRQIFVALDAVHRYGVVHRDVKPRNVVLHQSESGVISVKLVDFGICERIGRPSQTMTGAYAMGTPAYMAPEQLCGGPVDQRADIYSAGIILYEMLTGRRPFEGPNLELLTRAIMYAPVLPPSLLRGDCSKPLEEIVLSTLERALKKRMNNARDVAVRLQSIAKHERLPTGTRALTALGGPRSTRSHRPSGKTRRFQPSLRAR